LVVDFAATPEPPSMTTATLPVFPPPNLSFRVRVIVAVDIGDAVDLDHAERLIQDAARSRLRSGIAEVDRRSGEFEYEPLPLLIVEQDAPIDVAGMKTSGTVEITVYDFGAISICHDIRLPAGTEDLPRRMLDLVEPAALEADARTRAARLLDRLRDAVDRPSIADDVEEYAVVTIEPPADAPFDLDEFEPGSVARMLRAEPGELSGQEIADALTERLSYGPRDVAVVDWAAALVVDPAPEPTLEVLEFLNVQLLEFRLLDRRLDDALASAYQIVRRPRRGPASTGLGWRWTDASRDWRRIAEMQVDAAVLYESIQNALKLVGDQSVARLMSMASRRFHLPRWEASILRKLDVLESIHQKLADARAHHRAELLEWIIIALIAFEIVFGLVGALT
jgi:hypothetical protein